MIFPGTIGGLFVLSIEMAGFIFLSEFEFHFQN